MSCCFVSRWSKSFRPWLPLGLAPPHPSTGHITAPGESLSLLHPPSTLHAGHPNTNGIRLERASQKQSSDTHKTPYDRVKRLQERKLNIKVSERVNSRAAQFSCLGFKARGGNYRSRLRNMRSEKSASFSPEARTICGCQLCGRLMKGLSVETGPGGRLYNGAGHLIERLVIRWVSAGESGSHGDLAASQQVLSRSRCSSGCYTPFTATSSHSPGALLNDLVVICKSSVLNVAVVERCSWVIVTSSARDWRRGHGIIYTPIRVIEVNMERRRNDGGGETGNPLRKPADERRRAARFPLAKIVE
ncbi:hypothetical protein PR048_026235 [Dryococelus australis]|uniref:Uncharacterized protein n=1 Tax=Dryococelus australis TaxID=614101 RepID=A0ABQ9GKS8_9NEOP|nr:hypothetical protein PR048_026235 [Dryococelus australis]